MAEVKAEMVRMWGGKATAIRANYFQVQLARRNGSSYTHISENYTKLTSQYTRIETGFPDKH
jgi:hypothetical protein